MLQRGSEHGVRADDQDLRGIDHLQAPKITKLASWTSGDNISTVCETIPGRAYAHRHRASTKLLGRPTRMSARCTGLLTPFFIRISRRCFLQMPRLRV